MVDTIDDKNNVVFASQLTTYRDEILTIYAYSHSQGPLTHSNGILAEVYVYPNNRCYCKCPIPILLEPSPEGCADKNKTPSQKRSRCVVDRKP